MNRLYWTVPEAVELLAEAYWVDQGGQGLNPDPVALEALARVLKLNPEYLEQVWEVWEDELVLSEWSPERRDQARYWLDVAFIGGISS